MWWHSPSTLQDITSGEVKSAQWSEMLAGGSAFKAEFSDREGRTYGSLGLRPDQIIVLHYEPLASQPRSQSSAFSPGIDAMGLGCGDACNKRMMCGTQRSG
jgi:hypothetical protein